MDRMGTDKPEDANSLGDATNQENINNYLTSRLGWLADAPLFIDGEHIESFYNAVVNPTYEQEEATLRVTKNVADRIRKEFNVTGRLSLGSLGGLFAGLLPSATVGAGARRAEEHGESDEETQELKLRAIRTPQSQLVQLTLHYLFNQPHRFFLLDDLSNPQERSDFALEGSWSDPTTILEVPRGLVFLNLPSRAEAVRYHMPPTRLIPITAEFDNGEVVSLFERFVDEGQGSSKEAPPEYPEYEYFESYKGPQEIIRYRRMYWQWFYRQYDDNRFNSNASMRIIEEAAKGKGRIRWITYRVLLNREGDSLHVSIFPTERDTTGTFAYAIIRRGYEHGLRLIGTLKSEPSMNVLAIYEK